MSGRRRRMVVRRLRGRLLGGVAALLAALASLLPWRCAQAVGRVLGRLGWLLAARDRRRTLEHLAVAFPEATPGRRSELGRASFIHLGTMLGECLWLARRDCRAVRERVEVAGREHVEAARASGRPILVVTGHCGNWELLAAVIPCGGLPLSVIARQLDDPSLDRLIVGLRARFGTQTIPRGSAGATRALLRTLRAGGAIALLIDQDIDVGGAWVPFFGRRAHTPLGAAQLALRHGCVVLPTFIERREDGSHLATYHPPMDLPEDPEAATAAMTARIEEQIRRRPEQWVWLHRRWRRRPPDEEAAARPSPA